MSRHLWNTTTRSRSDHPQATEPDPEGDKLDPGHLRIFAATMRALTGLAAQATASPAEQAEPADPPDESTVEFSRADLIEATRILEANEPAVFLLPRGRHSLQ